MPLLFTFQELILRPGVYMTIDSDLGEGTEVVSLPAVLVKLRTCSHSGIAGLTLESSDNTMII